MNITLDTLNKTVTLNSNVTINEMNNFINNLLNTGIIDNTWTIGPYVNYTYTSPYISIPHSGGICNGTCATSPCTCGMITTTN